MNSQWRPDNQVQLLINGEDYFASAFAAIEQARAEILLETFIIFEDKVGKQLQQLLIAAARRGVKVEMLVDGYGTADLSLDYLRELSDAGVHLQAFDPSPKRLGMRTNLFRRLHRKILVVDGEVGFVGGINYCADHLADFGPMAKQDYAVQVRGPIVADLQRATLTLLEQQSALKPGTRRWWQRRVPIAADSEQASMTLCIRDNQDHPNDIEQHYLRALNGARERITIANAYFFPGYRLLRAIRNAARRGVKVTLVLQGMPDMPWVRLCSRLLYNYLIRDGVRIFEYCERPLHGKVALVDRHWSTVGSSNLDPLSLALNLEANLVIRDQTFNSRLHEHLQELTAHRCKPVSLQRALRGYWWRAPLIFLTFHFIRRFPAVIGWLPAHVPRLKPLYDGEQPAGKPT
ncbi:cardiolipin synthase ClsB [Pseudomonas sp. NPDC087612]|uniref:cardiolipin synthase ClsB n=1 Tax=unclassified Pseudomonas TaxID=196821 RepID=UPI0005EAE663|nr:MULTISPECIES: cardiolipin synthase ClsB [unclassified Pseudomonas]KJK17001.1 cardiolipin synthase 2 [Pseudomonas sp. 2(2015)]UVL54151.1 cardiolipin synthase ClsB [Pseudomonas sp. B21-035]SDQ65209.1 cardiolipin synthase [Pseudomonas sp. UC 17F4]